MAKIRALAFGLTLILLFGCTETGSPEEHAALAEYCHFSVDEIQNFCGVNGITASYAYYALWDNATREYSDPSETDCIYSLSENESGDSVEGAFTKAWFQPEMTFAQLKEEMQEGGFSYQEVDVGDEAIYLDTEEEGIYRRAIFFQKGGQMHYVEFSKKPGLFWHGKCETKEGLIELARLYEARLGN